MLCLGMLIVRLGSADETVLHGRGRTHHPYLAILLTICAANLAAPPGFGPFLSLTLIYDGLTTTGYAWARPDPGPLHSPERRRSNPRHSPHLLGLGPRPRPDPDQPGTETPPHSLQPPSPMAPTAPLFLAVIAYFLAFAPDLPGHAIKAAAALHDHATHARQVIQE